jgi:chorismate mutase
LPLLDAGREQEILHRARSLNGGPLDSRAVSGFFRWLLKESRRLTARALRASARSARKGER